MEENKELNDIILDKGNSKSVNFKKVALIVAALSVLLIVVVVVTGSLNKKDDQASVAQTVLPPEPEIPEETKAETDPLFKPVDVINDNNLDNITKRLKEESLKEENTNASEVEVKKDDTEVVKKEEPIEQPLPAVIQDKIEKAQPVAKKPEPVVEPVAPKAVVANNYYIQVGSFSIFKPDPNFLKRITSNGFSYATKKVSINGKSITKLFIGPYEDENSARKALKAVRDTIEAKAFLTRG